MMQKINLGCGTDYREGFINCDFNQNIKADKYFDINQGLPFESNSIDLLVASNLLEHLVYPERILQEIERVLKPNATAEITLPHFSWLDHHRDLTHRFFCTSQTFCKQVQKISYQTNFKIDETIVCCPYWMIVHYLPLWFLEKIRYPIYQITWKLKKVETESDK